MDDRKLVVLDTDADTSKQARDILETGLKTWASKQAGNEKLKDKKIDNVVFRKKTIIITYI